jgi:hypothetical protein
MDRKFSVAFIHIILNFQFLASYFLFIPEAIQYLAEPICSAQHSFIIFILFLFYSIFYLFQVYALEDQFKY